MPQFNKSPKTLEIGQLFDPNASDSPVAHIFSEIQKRKQLQDVLAQALAKMGLVQFANEISLGEITLEGEIKLITQKAGILTKLKNKLLLKNNNHYNQKDQQCQYLMIKLKKKELRKFLNIIKSDKIFLI